MDKHDVIEVLCAHEAEIRAGGATALYLFGSVVRGEAGPDSDVDIFIDYDPQGSFNIVDLIHLEQRISGLLGTHVDLTTRGGLHPRLRSHIVEQAQRVF